MSWDKKQNCSGRSKTDSNWMDVKDASGWQSLEINGLAVPVQTKNARLELIQTIRGKGRFSMFRDDIYFKAVAR